MFTIDLGPNYEYVRRTDGGHGTRRSEILFNAIETDDWAKKEGGRDFFQMPILHVYIHNSLIAIKRTTERHGGGVRKHYTHRIPLEF